MKKVLNLAVPFLVAACAGGEPDADTTPDMDSSAGTVTIVTPSGGALVNGTTVTVQLSSSIQIVPAGDLTEGTGHHHLFLDSDLTPEGQPVPTIPGSIVHMGDASSAYVFEDVTPGEHRVIAVIADGVHVPIQPWIVDTVTFTVAN